MELYAIYFVSLALCNAALAWYRHRQTSCEKSSEEEQESLSLPSGSTVTQQARKFKITYFSIYGLVMAADWLQGPYMYTVYKDEKHLPESTVAALFTTGFVCAGITASFIGSLADQYARRLACILFCVAYSISCLSVLSNETWIFFVGRALGGLSTTLLYSVFETWMIAESHARDLNDVLRLGDMFSFSVTLSGIVAIVAGIVGEAVVRYTGTRSAPFMAAIACLTTAFGGICKFWDENISSSQPNEKHASHTSTPTLTIRDLLKDKGLLTLTLATTIFEGSMYLFVYFWSPALIASRLPMASSSPFGLIFSSFMAAMMLGSLVFNLQTSSTAPQLLLTIFGLASNALLFPVLMKGEAFTFWSFALFEMCVGLYFPTIGRLKSDLVENSVRGKVYGWMRLPLNVFVVVALGVTREGDAHRHSVFMATGVLLLGAFFVAYKYLVK